MPAERRHQVPITAEQVDAQRFTPVRLREGYDMKEVDDFLDRISATLRGDSATPLSAADVEDVLFTPRRLREGYDMGEVDHLLDLVIETLRGQESTADQAIDQATEQATEPQPSGQGETPSALAPLEGPFTTCGICFVPIRVADEDGHRGWHVGRLG